MPCGAQLIEAVAAHLSPDEGNLVGDLLYKSGRTVTMRAIRYAITELIKTGRARRDGRNGPVYAVIKPPEIWEQDGVICEVG